MRGDGYVTAATSLRSQPSVAEHSRAVLGGAGENFAQCFIFYIGWDEAELRSLLGLLLFQSSDYYKPEKLTKHSILEHSMIITNGTSTPHEVTSRTLNWFRFSKAFITHK
ncbi:unnamed protein product [Danaus chrysippus]|uniref:(African queen) hypothetical protein n=1 Tax=Danaus chrysippus TaxID=151541 RepID=A0A8J2QJG6_9NEOP|nr:unnamed protein product [Danaus chrysippus]